MIRRLACVMLVAWSVVAAAEETPPVPAESLAPENEAKQTEPGPAPQPTEAGAATAPAGTPVDSVPSALVEVIGTSVGVVRTGPGTQHAIAATVHEGDVLRIDARSGAWYHLRLADDRSGWMHEDLLRTYTDPSKFQFAPDPGRPSRMRSFHFMPFIGQYAADREDNGLLIGARIGYSLTRRFGFEAGAGFTRVVRTTYVLERIYGLRLEEENFELFFYEAGLSMDLLPGRRVTPFMTVGLGASVLNAAVEPTYAIGVGTKVFLSQRTAMRWEIRDHRLKGGNQFTRFSGDNLEFSGGIELLF